MEINTNELVQNEILQLWNEFKEYDFCKLRPLAPPTTIKKSALLFVGLNPSIRKSDEAGISEYDGQLDNIVYDKVNDKYYSKFDKITKNTGFEENWTHFDMLFYRESQDEVRKLISKKFNDEFSNKGNEFIFRQLLISKKLLEQSEPKMIVFANRLAGEFTGINRDVKDGKVFGEWLNLNFEEKEDHYLLNGVPVIFSKQPNRYFTNEELEELRMHIANLKQKYTIS